VNYEAWRDSSTLVPGVLRAAATLQHKLAGHIFPDWIQGSMQSFWGALLSSNDKTHTLLAMSWAGLYNPDAVFTRLARGCLRDGPWKIFNERDAS
jgi:hypothetical protein